MPEALEAEIRQLYDDWIANPSAVVCARLADRLRIAGRPAEAIDVAGRGLVDWPASTTIRVVFGRCHRDVGNIPEARDAFEKVLESDPLNLFALRGSAEIAMAEGRFADAMKLFGDYLFENQADSEAEKLLEEATAHHREASQQRARPAPVLEVLPPPPVEAPISAVEVPPVGEAAVQAAESESSQPLSDVPMPDGLPARDETPASADTLSGQDAGWGFEGRLADKLPEPAVSDPVAGPVPMPGSLVAGLPEAFAVPPEDPAPIAEDHGRDPLPGPSGSILDILGPPVAAEEPAQPVQYPATARMGKILQAQGLAPEPSAYPAAGTAPPPPQAPEPSRAEAITSRLQPASPPRAQGRRDPRSLLDLFGSEEREELGLDQYRQEEA
jgi:tetratricopeptide (TPR) repeat protein